MGLKYQKIQRIASFYSVKNAPSRDSLLIFSNRDMAGSHFSERCLHWWFFTLNYAPLLALPVEAMMEVPSTAQSRR